MPRIRKKTSKRGTTHQRSKIKQKVAESHKKSKRDAKKNTQWKSKHAKDPGIPNDFPFKDQILAEVAAQRRQDEEEKQRRKEQRRVARAAASSADVENDDKGNGAGETEGFDGIRTITPSASKAPTKSLVLKGKEKATVEEEDDAPILMNTEYVDLKSVLDQADVILQVVDARDPVAYQSSHLIDYVTKGGKGKIMLVINKIDTCPREAVQAWASSLRRQHNTFLFRSASAFLPNVEEQAKSNEKQRNADAIGADSILNTLGAEASRKGDGPLLVAIVGVANTGKSSLVNSLLRKSISPIYKLVSGPSSPSTTEKPLEVTLEHEGKKIHIIDTPALSWEQAEDLDEDVVSEKRAKDVLLRSKGRIDRAKDPITPVNQIVARANVEDLMLFYNLPAFAKGDGTAFLSALSRPNGLVKKHGELDLAGAARIVLRDWSTGKFPRYTQPLPRAESSEDVAGDADLAGLYAADEELLLAAPTKKEMRKGVGLVRLVPGEVETRRVAMQKRWDGDDDSDEDEAEAAKMEVDADEDDEEEVEAEMTDGDDDDDEEIDEEDDLQEEEVLPPPPSDKRKRQGKSTPAPASKKVSFATEPKGTKQARAQPSKKPSAHMTPGGKSKKGRK